MKCDLDYVGPSGTTPSLRAMLRGSTLMLGLLALAFTAGVQRAHAQEMEVTEFVLIDAAADVDIGPMTDGMIINLDELPSRSISIRAESVGEVASVVFGFDDNPRFQVETNPPRVIRGDDNAGDIFGFTPDFGEHTVTATPYSEPGGGGEAGIPLTLTFTVTGNPPSIDSTLVVTDFILVDAESNLDLVVMTNGMVIDYDELPSRSISIRVEATEGTSSVVFGFDDEPRFQVETGLPWVIRGDDQNGDIFGFTPDLGEHTVTVTPYSEPGGLGTPGVPTSLTFTLTGSDVTEDPSLIVSEFLLMDSDSNEVIGPLEDGMVIWREDMPTVNLNVYAVTEGEVGSVMFNLNNGRYTMLENNPPFGLFGDFGDWTPSAGEHTLTVTPYANDGAAGNYGIPLTVDFTVAGLLLLDAGPDTVLTELVDSMTIDPSVLGISRFNVYAAVGDVGSVVFDLNDGEYTWTETTPPYGLYGDFDGWTPEPGEHKLVATTYSEAGGQGTAGRALSVTFFVEGEGVAVAEPDETPSEFAIKSIYPNPFNPSTSLILALHEVGDYDLRVYNVLGQLVREQVLSVHAPGEVQVSMDIHDQASGLYFFSVRHKASGRTVSSVATLLK